MNFGASHLVQTSALLKKDSKRHLNGVLTLHAAPKGSADNYASDSHASPRSEVLSARQQGVGNHSKDIASSRCASGALRSADV